MRVRGRVLDFFRAQRLITRLPKKSEDKPDAPRYTMLYKDRFLSANNPVLRKSSNSSRVSEGGPSPHGEIISYFDLFPSKDRAGSRRRVEMISVRRLRGNPGILITYTG